MSTVATESLKWLSRSWESGIDSAKLRNDAATQSGIVGDLAHRLSGGYHISRQDQSSNNYSCIRVDDRPGNGPNDAASAIDMNYGRVEDLIETFNRFKHIWLDDRNHPVCRFLNAVNGWDGFDSAGRIDFVTWVESTSTEDHKWHIHLEIRRKYVNDMNAMKIILGVILGGNMDPDLAVSLRAFLQDYGTSGIGGNSWAARAIEKPLNNLTGMVAKLPTSTHSVMLTDAQVKMIADQLTVAVTAALTPLVAALDGVGEVLAKLK